RPLKHRGRHVDTSRLANSRSKGAHDQPWPTGDVENGVIRAGSGGRHNHLQRILVSDRRGGAEDRRLACELVEDQLFVVCVSHRFPQLSQSGPLGNTSTLPWRPPCCARISAARISSIG